MDIETALQQHIHDALARGASRKELENTLIAAGWPKEVVQSYTQQAKKQHPGPALIKLQGATKRFGEKLILDHIDLEIPPGELFGIIGLSGVGKTTLLNTIVGFIELDAGDVILKLPDGTESSVFKQPEIIKNMFGFASQIPSFYGRLTARENIEHFASLYNIPPNTRVTRTKALLKLVGLDESANTLAQNLSGGMQKRLDIACAIIHKPDVLILDEPTADLDPFIRKQIWNLIRHINRRGTTVIVASHVVSELERNCSRIAILRDHRITEVGTPQELKDIYSTNYEIFIEIASRDYASLQRMLSKGKAKNLFPSMKQRGNRLILQTAKPNNALELVIAAVKKSGDKITHLHVDRPSITEVFASLVKK